MGISFKGKGRRDRKGKGKKRETRDGRQQVTAIKRRKIKKMIINYNE